MPQKVKYIVDDFVPRTHSDVTAYLNARSENGFELVSVIRFENFYGPCERYFWRFVLAENVPIAEYEE